MRMTALLRHRVHVSTLLPSMRPARSRTMATVGFSEIERVYGFHALLLQRVEGAVIVGEPTPFCHAAHGEISPATATQPQQPSWRRAAAELLLYERIDKRPLFRTAKPASEMPGFIELPNGNFAGVF